MGAAVGTGDGKRSVNVELNIVPFIDLMSCLTAFLLVTAVWVNIAQINIQPKGKARDAAPAEPSDTPILSVLIQADKIWVGLSRVNEFQDIAKKGDGEQDWDKFESTLKEHKASSFFSDPNDPNSRHIEIAAESTSAQPVQYQDIIHAMDIAVKVNFDDVGLTDPAGLAARPSL
jgi:biopolymer transport protein ExbD